ncbi:hypothetical protein [Secundilactobacillus folii]|uniref:Uncharacterized protein n=1 Tax=Secundilactobacillus folii TaxID=2678357 RepID=A0A7X2XWM7_9LACO|nr:hypothetical protein [Secundilactobacillus folii]MTV82450.1 hypothetical protein [Secundilactobacillus folii]
MQIKMSRLLLCLGVTLGVFANSVSASAATESFEPYTIEYNYTKLVIDAGALTRRPISGTTTYRVEAGGQFAKYQSISADGKRIFNFAPLYPNYDWSTQQPVVISKLEDNRTFFVSQTLVAKKALVHLNYKLKNPDGQISKKKFQNYDYQTGTLEGKCVPILTEALGSCYELEDPKESLIEADGQSFDTIIHRRQIDFTIDYKVVSDQQISTAHLPDKMEANFKDVKDKLSELDQQVKQAGYRILSNQVTYNLEGYGHVTFNLKTNNVSGSVSNPGESVEKPRPTPETKPEIVPEAKPEVKPETEPDEGQEMIPAPKPDVTPEVEPEAKPSEKPQVTPDFNPEEKPEGTPDIKPDVTPEIKSEEKPEVAPDTKPDQRPEGNSDTKPETTPETKPENKPEVTPEIKPDEKPDVTPETKPEEKPDQISEPDAGDKTGTDPEVKPNERPVPNPDFSLKPQPDNNQISENDLKKPEIVADNQHYDDLMYQLAKIIQRLDKILCQLRIQHPVRPHHRAPKSHLKHSNNKRHHASHQSHHKKPHSKHARHKKHFSHRRHHHLKQRLHPGLNQRH